MSTPFSHFFAKINHFSPLEHNFTEELEAIALKPKTLYSYGKMPQNVSKNTSKNGKSEERPKVVAIVGSRHNTRYGHEVAYRLAYALAKEGVIVVSGLAFGIDSIAHRGCLDAGGTTVAVLGSPIDKIYPTAHVGLAREIIEKGGMVMSEYAPSTPDFASAPLAPCEYLDDRGRRQVQSKGSFLYRNRLISGLSDAVVIVEAAVKSGSLNTAAHAIEQGKEVFAVPGNITNPYSQGCNKLIRQGAQPYTCPDDVLDYLFPERVAAKHSKHKQLRLFGDNDVETAILTSLSEGISLGEEVMTTSRLPAEVFNESITLLEIKGRVKSLGANRWCLA